MARSFADTLREHAAEALDLENRHAEEFGRMVEELQYELRGRLLAMEGGTFDAFRAKEALAIVETLIRTLEEKAHRWNRGAHLESTDLALDHISQDVASMSKAFETSPYRLSLMAAKTIADPRQLLLAQQFNSSVKKYGLELLGRVRFNIFASINTGDSTRDVIKKVAGDKGPIGTVGMSDAERLIRTETSQVYNVAQKTGLRQAAEQIPGLKMMWLHIGSYKCRTCNPLHGTVREIGGTWTIGKRQVAHPPAHPNCLLPGTLIMAPHGEAEPIERIRIGQMVIGGMSGKPRKVTQVHATPFEGIVYTVAAGGHSVTLTGNHPLLTITRDWCAAEELMARDLLTAHGAVSDAGVQIRQHRIDHMGAWRYAGIVHNLSVESDQSYLANGLIVHNCTCRVSAVKPAWRSSLKRLGYLGQPIPKKSGPGEAEL